MNLVTRIASRARLCLALALGGASCINVSPPGTMFASEPPGARVHVDGVDTGWVTPCEIALDVEQPHDVVVALEGFTPREIRIEPYRRLAAVDWEQGVSGVRSSVQFLILLPLGDFFFPLREQWTLAPGRVFVRLRPESGS